MNKITARLVTGLTAVLAVAGLAVLSAPTASAAPPQGLATSVTCYNGAARCTEYRYGFSLPGATGQFGVYYTVQWSSSGGSYKVIKTRWVNNSNKTVYWGGDGVHTVQTGYAGLNNGTSSTTFAVPAGTSWTYVESQFNGAAKGLWIPRADGAYAVTQENVTSWQYHVSGYGSISGAFLLG